MPWQKSFRDSARGDQGGTRGGVAPKPERLGLQGHRRVERTHRPHEDGLAQSDRPQGLASAAVANFTSGSPRSSVGTMVGQAVPRSCRRWDSTCSRRGAALDLAERVGDRLFAELRLLLRPRSLHWRTVGSLSSSRFVCRRLRGETSLLRPVPRHVVGRVLQQPASERLSAIISAWANDTANAGRADSIDASTLCDPEEATTHK